MESLTLTLRNVFISKLLIRSGLGPCFPTHCHQFSLLSLVKKHRIISSQWDVPASSQRSLGGTDLAGHTLK